MRSVCYQFEGEAGPITATDVASWRAVVVFLHGTGGDIGEMTAPEISPGSNFDRFAPFPADRDVRWRPTRMLVSGPLSLVQRNQ